MSLEMTAVARPNKVSRIVVWIVGFLAFLNLYPMQAVLPLLMTEFSADAVQAGATVGATVLAIALLSPFVGVWSDAVGRRGLINAALFALTVLTFAISLSTSLDVVLMMRFLQGMAIPGVTVVLTAYLAEEFDGAEVSRLMTAYISGGVFGGFSGRFVAGYMGDFLGWRAAFIVLGSLTLCGALFVWRRLPASRRFVARRDVSGILLQFRRHAANRQLLLVCLIGFCILFSLVGGLTYLMLFLSKAPFSLSPRDLGNVFLVYLIGALVTPLAAGAMTRLGLRAVLLLALAGAAAGLLLTFVPELPLIVFGLTLFSSGIFVAQTVAIRRVAEVVCEGRSLAAGIYGTYYYAGGAVGTWLCGLAYVRADWQGSGVVVLTTLVLAAAAGIMAWRQPH